MDYEMQIPDPKNTIAALIDAAHEEQPDQPRAHIGASQLGHHCDRWIWLSFRWAVQPRHSGRVLRLFRRGQNEESVVISDLRAAGVDVQYTGRNQLRLDFGCHVSGSVDGIVESGVPEAPRKRHILEIKTHSKKSFDDLEKNGVEKSKPVHFVQIQVYMHGAKIDRALYFAVCKDDDRIYSARIRYSKEIAERAIARGHRLALDERIPPPISTDPSWYQCKTCVAHEFCHVSHLTRHVNCRTCAHATPTPESIWTCGRFWDAEIAEEYQRAGCGSHVLHPDLVPWKLYSDASTETEAVYIVDGTPVRNGEGDAYTFASSELIANPSACASIARGDEPELVDLRNTFNARING